MPCPSRPASTDTGATWQANGGTVYCRSNHPMTIHSAIFNFDRSHKAR